MNDFASMHFLKDRGRLSREQCLALVLERENQQISEIERFEAQLAVAKQSLLSIRSAANTFRLPSLLPDELLADIMALAYGFNHRDESFQVEFWRPIWLSHVCTRWRRVAFAMPRLWSNIPLGHLEVRELFLSRMRNAPMDVKSQSNVCLYTKTCSGIAQTVHDHASQLRSVQLKLHDRHDLLSICQRLAERPLPQLLHLTLALFSKAQGQRLSGQLFEVFNTMSSPALRHVNFLFLPIPLASPLLRGGELRCLQISRQNFVDLDELLEVFCINQHLVEVRLTDLGLLSSSSGSRRRDPVHLRSLKLMVIEDVSNSLELLRGITTSGSICIAGSVERYPELADLLIDQDRGFHDLRAFEDRDVLSAFVRHRTVCPTHVQDFSHRVEFAISLYPVAFPDDTPDHRDPPQLELKLVHPIYGPWGTLTFHSIGGASFPLSRLQHLHLYDVHNIAKYDRPNEMDLQHWNTMFSALRSLRGLVLDRSTFHLPMVSLTNGEEGTGVLRCPLLQSISITVTALVDSVFESPPNAAREGFASLIPCVLKRRAQSNGDRPTPDDDAPLAPGLRTLSIRLLTLDAKDERRRSFKAHAAAFVDASTGGLDAVARRVVERGQEGMEGSLSWKWEF